MLKHAPLRRKTLKGLLGILAAQHAPALWAQPFRLRVGQSAPLSGSNADFGRAIVAGAHACFSQHNAGGSTPIEHILLDDGNEAARSGANTDALLEQGSSLLFGYASATLSLPALPIVRRSGVPFFAPFTGAATIHRLQDPLVFTARASYAQEADKFMQAVVPFGVKTVAVVHYNDRVGLENRDVVVQRIQEAGLRADPVVSIERNKEVAISVVQALSSAEPDAIVFTVLATPTADLVRKLRESGLKPLCFLIALSFSGPSQLVRVLGEQARGIVVSHVVPRPWESLPVVQEHVRAMRAFAPQEAPTFASLESYLAAKAVALAAQRARSAKSSAMLAALESVEADFGGYRLSYGRNVRNGSRYVAYTIIGKETVR
jgi:branched-chain amino acid transport system substrate-binding protein